MDSLDPCSDDDINNDLNSLYVEVIVKNRTYYKCTICGRKLWRKQGIETHLSCVHGKSEKEHKPITILNACDYKSCFILLFITEGYHIRNYKKYLDDPSVPVPNQQSLTVTSVQQHVPA